MKQILCINTAGKDRQDALRMRRLASHLNADVTYYDIDRSVSRVTASRSVWRLLKTSKWDLVYQEGTGIAGGANLIRAAWAWKQPYVISSGDPIGGYFRTKYGFLVGNSFEFYERLLYRACVGFIGWTPYLTGAALKMGAKNAVTVEGAVDLSIFKPCVPAEKSALRQRYNIPNNHLVCGIAGSLNWIPRQSWCQGYELVHFLKRLKREDVSLLIVGDGNGRAHLERAIPDTLRSRIVFTGRVPETQVADLINVMDIGFVTQIMGPLGNYRLSTKLPEYLACGVPVAMSPIPGFYDYAAPAGWPLPPYHPASEEFHQRCAKWIEQLSWSDLEEKKNQALEIAHQRFSYEKIAPKFCSFIHELLYPGTPNKTNAISSLAFAEDEAGDNPQTRAIG